MVYLIEGNITIEDYVKRNIFISKTKISEPKEGWEKYLTREFIETKKWKTINGRLEVWKEIRFPTPWIYFISDGEIIDIFTFDGKEFISNPKEKYEGRKITYGLITPILDIRKSKKEITTYKIISGY